MEYFAQLRRNPNAILTQKKNREYIYIKNEMMFYLTVFFEDVLITTSKEKNSKKHMKQLI